MPGAATIETSRLLDRFTPDGTEVATPEGLRSAYVPVPVTLLPLMRLPFLPSRPLAIVWMAFLIEIESARMEKSAGPRTVPVSLLPKDAFRRGGMRALRDTCGILSRCLSSGALPLFSSSPAIRPELSELHWDISAQSRATIEAAFRLDRRRVAHFVRVELSTALYARTRWTMPLYPAIARRLLAARVAADDAGWVPVVATLGELAEELGWHGVQLKDFRAKALDPALIDLGIDERPSRASPRYLQLRYGPSVRGELHLLARRIGRTGAWLDAQGVRDRNKANRRRIVDEVAADDAEDRISSHEAPLKQGIKW